MYYEILPKEISKIINKRRQIRKLILDTTPNNEKNANIETYSKPNVIGILTLDHLNKIFTWYDTIFFNNEFDKMIKTKNINLKFGFLRSIQKAGEHCYDSKDNSCKISISKKTLIGLFTKGEKRLWVNGLNVRDRIEALQVVFEHEMVHMYMVLKGYSGKIKSGKGKMYYSSHGKLFQELSKLFFLHTDYRHLLTNGDSCGHLTKERCNVNMEVYFKNDKKNDKKGDKNNKKNRIYGTVIKCNPKKAKILCVTQGTEKIYSVPYSMLHKK